MSEEKKTQNTSAAGLAGILIAAAGLILSIWNALAGVILLIAGFICIAISRKHAGRNASVPHAYEETSIASGDTAEDPQPEVKKGEDFLNLIDQTIHGSSKLLYTSGSAVEGGLEFTYQFNHEIHASDMQKLKKVLQEKCTGAFNVIYLSDTTFRILYIPA